MNSYGELGFFDFEDFVEELNEEELFCLNGGACGAGSSSSYTPHYSCGCDGGGAVTPSYTPSIPTSSCGGSYYYGSIRQICTNPSDYHCDIYAWNLAIDNGLDPAVKKSSQIDLNRYTVEQMYNYYYKNLSSQKKGQCPQKAKGLAFYDRTNDGIFNPTHVEYFDSVNGAPGEYIQYKTDGISTPQKVGRSLTDSRNTNWTYVILN